MQEKSFVSLIQSDFNWFKVIKKTYHSPIFYCFPKQLPSIQLDQISLKVQIYYNAITNYNV